MQQPHLQFERYPGGQCIELLSDPAGADGMAPVGDGELYIDLDVPMPTLFIPEYTFDCDDTGSNVMFVEVEDVNGNAGYGMINIAVYDTTAPMVNIFDLEDYTLYARETCVDEVDLFAAGQPWYEADDNCEQDVEIIYDIINETGIAGCREFDRRWDHPEHGRFGQHVQRHDPAAHHRGGRHRTDRVLRQCARRPDHRVGSGPCAADIPEAGTALDSVAVTFTYTIDQYAGEAQMTILDSEGEVIEFIDIVSGGTSTHPYDLYYTNGADNTGGYTLIQTLTCAW